MRDSGVCELHEGARKETVMAAYIPPGSQEPFSKDRAYGQEPGFVSRHYRALVVLVVLIVIAAIVTVPLTFFNDDDQTTPTSQEN
jgi:hypothetical protein